MTKRTVDIVPLFKFKLQADSNVVLSSLLVYLFISHPDHCFPFLVPLSQRPSSHPPPSLLRRLPLSPRYLSHPGASNLFTVRHIFSHWSQIRPFSWGTESIDRQQLWGQPPLLLNGKVLNGSPQNQEIIHFGWFICLLVIFFFIIIFGSLVKFVIIFNLKYMYLV